MLLKQRAILRCQRALVLPAVQGLVCKFVVAEPSRPSADTPLHAHSGRSVTAVSSGSKAEEADMQPEAYQIARSDLGATSSTQADLGQRQQPVGVAAQPTEKPAAAAAEGRGAETGAGRAAAKPAPAADAQQEGTPCKKKKGKRRSEQAKASSEGGEGAAIAQTSSGGEAGSCRPTTLQQEARGAGVPGQTAAAGEGSGEQSGSMQPSSGNGESGVAVEPAPAATSAAATPPRPPSAGNRRRQHGERRQSEGNRPGTPRNNGSRAGTRAETPLKQPLATTPGRAPGVTPAATPAAMPAGTPNGQQEKREQGSRQRRGKPREKLSIIEQHPDLFPGTALAEEAVADAAEPEPSIPAPAAAVPEGRIPAGATKPAAEGTEKRPPSRRSAAARVRHGGKLAATSPAVPVGDQPEAPSLAAASGGEVVGAASSSAPLSPVISACTAPAVASPVPHPSGLSLAVNSGTSTPTTPRSDGGTGSSTPLPASWPVPPGPSEYGVQYDFGQASPLELSIDLPELPSERMWGYRGWRWMCREGRGGGWVGQEGVEKGLGACMGDPGMHADPAHGQEGACPGPHTCPGGGGGLQWHSRSSSPRA